MGSCGNVVVPVANRTGVGGSRRTTNGAGEAIALAGPLGTLQSGIFALANGSGFGVDSTGFAKAQPLNVEAASSAKANAMLDRGQCEFVFLGKVIRSCVRE